MVCSFTKNQSYHIKSFDIVGKNVDHLSRCGLSHGYTTQTQCLKQRETPGVTLQLNKNLKRHNIMITQQNYYYTYCLFVVALQYIQIWQRGRHIAGQKSMYYSN